MLTCIEFSEVYKSSFQSTRGLLLSRGIGVTLADELAQAAWARAWERRAQLREKARVVGWVGTIALNLLRNEMRRYTDYLPLLDSQMPSAGSENGCSKVVSKVDLDRALKWLTAEDKRLLISSVIGGWTSRESAEHANLSPGAVRVRLHRAKRMVQERKRIMDKHRAA